MTANFQVNWAPSRFFDNDEKTSRPEDALTGSGSMLKEHLAVAYLARVELYKKQLQSGYNRIRYGNFAWADARPRLKVSLPGGEKVIQFDEELDARLVEIYILYGWEGILCLEEALKKVQRQKESERPTDPWEVVAPFYFFARNRLILLIRQELIEIEKKASADIISRLSQTAVAVNNAWVEKYQFAEITSADEGGYDTDPQYTMGNRELAGELFSCFEELFKKKQQLENLEAKIGRIADALEAGDEEFGKGNAPGTGWYGDLENLKKDAEELHAQVNDLYNAISAKELFALLALPLLKPPISQSEMENAIGAALFPFYQKLDKLGEAIDPQKSLVEANSAGVDQVDVLGKAIDPQKNPLEGNSAVADKVLPNDFRKIESLYEPGYNLESKFAEKATGEVVDHPEYQTMLSASTLNSLVDSGGIEFGSLAFFACQNFITVLNAQIAKMRENEKKWEEFFRILAKGGSALSLASFVLRGNPAASAAAKTGALILGVPAAVYQIYSVIHQIHQFDEIVNRRLVDAGEEQAAKMAGIAEIAAMRAEYGRQITQVAATEIGLMIAGGEFEDFKELLHIRDYYLDLETLLE